MNVEFDNIPKTLQLKYPAIGHSDLTSGEGQAIGPELVLLDQTKLPYEESYIRTTDWNQAVSCIKELVVRGAPAIGIAGACALVLRAFELVSAKDSETALDNGDDAGGCANDPCSLLISGLKASAETIKQARPTAVNLAWAVDGMLDKAIRKAQDASSPSEIAQSLYVHACDLIKQDMECCKKIGEYGAELIEEDSVILTHCNAGALATAGIGTALGVIYTLAQNNKLKHVFADETRPVNQGARLTVWELSRAGIPTTLICDDMAASVMSLGKVDAVVVGADRIAGNGDVANKIGTLSLAIVADHFHIPFYVAAPVSTIDVHTPSGEDIPIEIRASQEVLPCAIDGVDVYNPAFDVTPAHLINAIITERGVFSPDDIKSAFRR